MRAAVSEREGAASPTWVIGGSALPLPLPSAAAWKQVGSGGGSAAARTTFEHAALPTASHDHAAWEAVW